MRPGSKVRCIPPGDRPRESRRLSVNVNRFLALLFLAPLWVASAGYAGTLSWELPTNYADGDPIATEASRRILVEVYAGPSKNGPWKWIATSLPGATSVAVMDPSPWETLWYTAKSNLSGRESVYAVPVKKTNYSIAILPTLQKIAKIPILPTLQEIAKNPTLPTLKKIAKKVFTRNKLIFLFFLLLLAGVVWGLRVRVRKRKRIG
jgi:hypothetical protein